MALKDQRVLLSGGTSGLGLATIRLLLREGARVVTFGRDRDRLDAAFREVDAPDGRLHAVVADGATAEGADAVFGAVDEKLGGIDILVCNAALGADPLEAMREEEWRAVLDTNLYGYLALAHRALPRMKAQGGGQLLFVGSISTEIKAVGESVYAATKSGVQAFAETLRKEVADEGIRVGVIQPGSMATAMQECSQDEQREAMDAQEMLPPGEVAEAVLFMLTRPPNTDVVNLRIEPRLQKTS